MTTQKTTPRERVAQALRMEQPSEQPFSWGFGPNKGARESLLPEFRKLGLDWDKLRAATEDVVGLWPPYVGDRLPENTADYMGIWGIRTQSVSYGAGNYDDEIEFCPLAGVEDEAELADHRWPTTDEFDYADLNRQWKERDPERIHAVRLPGGNPFEIYSWMTGLEEAMMNLIAEPELVEAAMERITSFFTAHLTEMVNAFEGQVDLVQMGDDLGSQHGPLLSNQAYRDVIQPFHRKICRHIHELLPNAVIAYHTDGSVFRMLPDLLDSGIQLLEAVQVECAEMEPARLKEAFGDRLRFQGAISVQQVLPKLSADEVRRVCRELVETLGAGGGYIAAPSHAIQVGTPAENILAMLEEVLGEERYQAAREKAAL
jgi:uroporphyrinogen decarboxylase